MDDDWEMEDWEADDWAEESFDEYDGDPGISEAAEEIEVGFIEEEAEEGPYGDSWHAGSVIHAAETDHAVGGGASRAESGAPSHREADRMGWSAWEVGTVFALGGWLADQHADRTAREVAAALSELQIGRPATGASLSAAHPPPASGYRYRSTSGALRPNQTIDQDALFSELARAKARDEDLLIQAEGPDDVDRVLVLVISAVPASRGPRFWVVAEEHLGGFSAGRLIPVFHRPAASPVAVFATDHAHEAIDAAVWACEREGVPIGDFHVTRRHLTSRARGSRA